MAYKFYQIHVDILSILERWLSFAQIDAPMASVLKFLISYGKQPQVLEEYRADALNLIQILEETSSRKSFRVVTQNQAMLEISGEEAYIALIAAMMKLELPLRELYL